MNLLFSLPTSIDKSDVVFSLPFNLNRNVKKVNGHFVITKTESIIFLNDEEQNRFSLNKYDEFICEQLIGCSMLVGKKNEETEFLCAFSQEQFIRFAELAKVLNFYIRTGELLDNIDEDEPSCTKCGLPLDGAKACPFCAKKSQILIKMIKRVEPYKWQFVAAVVCTVLAEVVWLILPYLTRLIVDDYVTPVNKNWSGFLLICGGLLGLYLCAWLFEFINMRCSFKVALSTGRDLRQDVFEKSQRLSMSSISKRTAGELIKRVSNDAMKVQDFITANGKDAIVKIFSLIILTALLFIMNPKLAFVVLLPVPFVLFIIARLFNIMHIRYGRVWRMMNRHSSMLHDILNGIRVVKSYGNEKREIERYKEASLNWAKSNISADIVWNLTIPIAWFFLSIGNFFVLYFGGEMVLGKELSLGELIQYTTYVAMIYQPLDWLIHIPRVLADTSVSASKVFEILEEVSEVSDKENAVDLEIKGNIKFDDVYFGYKVYNPVLKGISCEIKQGEMIGIVGHSGVGKSTMINLMLRLYDCTQGAIKIDGVNIKEISQEALRKQVGVVLQETFLFDGSVFENISYAKSDASFEDIIQAAKIANAHDFIVKLPDGYNTRVGEKGYSLSGGERQRIAIARAILHNPKILILDEATASLDTQTEKQIQEALGRLIKGRTTIAIAHRLSTLSNADKLIVLDKGKLAEMGTHDELMRNQNVYYKLVMAQRQTTKMKNIAG